MNLPTRSLTFLNRAGVIGISLWLTSLILPAKVQAQSFSGITSGLFHPRSSEQFFLDGLERFEDEVDCLTDEERCGLTAQKLLTTSESLDQQQPEDLLPEEEWLRELPQFQELPQAN